MSGHNKFMQQAMELAEKNAAKGLGPFACVIVKKGKVIAIGVNEVTNKNDPTAHAEINAIKTAAKKLKSHELTGCTIYSSCYPCPMCLGAIYWARPKALFHVNTTEQAAKIGFDDSYIYNDLCKTNGRRKYKATRVSIDNPLRAFKTWEENPNKVEY